MRVLFIGGTGPVGQASIPFLLAEGHEVGVAHRGVHEPETLAALEHLHGEREVLLAPGGAAEQWGPEALVDTFAGGATASKGHAVATLAERAGASHLVAVSSIDVYRHCADAGVDGNAPVALARDPLPLREDARRRAGPSPGSGSRHDNVAMEQALGGVERVTILRPGAIYGPHLHPHVLRESYLVGRVARGEHKLPLPAGGTQLFHRVALERVGRAVAAALQHGPKGCWAANVADPRDFTFGGLAALVGARLNWEWDLQPVDWHAGDHPWNVRHPVMVDTTRLRDILNVDAPDPLAATEKQVDWLWEQRAAVAALLPA
jgi:nucleoside-diphosphate-sugar epimerase